MSSLLIVGSVAFDTIHNHLGSHERVIGGSATYASLAASQLAPVRLVGVVGKDFPREAVDMLRGHGVDTTGLEVANGETFHWEGRYSDDLTSRETIKTDRTVPSLRTTISSRISSISRYFWVETVGFLPCSFLLFIQGSIDAVGFGLALINTASVYILGEHILGNGGALSGKFKFRYQDDMFFDPDNNPINVSPSYTLLDAWAAYTTPDKRWEIKFW